ncbi:MAG: Snf7 family protein [Thermoprotei archaeon]|jgi:division protein CdvB (Snf7/Vps24/ESCRT-III family)
MANFARRWEREPKEPLSGRIRDAVYPSPPLKNKIDQVTRKLETQTMKLDQLYHRLQERDRRLFEQLVNAYIKNDSDRAYMYANEVAGVRKVAKVVLQSKIALESVILRLGTIKEIGDVVAAIEPAIGVVNAVKRQLIGILPEAERELGDIGEALTSVLTEAGEISGVHFGAFGPQSEEAEKILKEAQAVAESRSKEFSELPSPEKEKGPSTT